WKHMNHCLPSLKRHIKTEFIVDTMEAFLSAGISVEKLDHPKGLLNPEEYSGIQNFLIATVKYV
ncbi:hypothetical protein L9F63_018251, partial [Diploptera punctata]